MTLLTPARRAGDLALRGRFVVLAAWGVLWGVLLLPAWNVTDWFFFEFSDRIWLHRQDVVPGPGGALHLYANFPRVQIGPPALLVALPTQFVPPHLGRVLGCVITMALGLVFLVLLERLGRTLRPDRDPRLVVLVGGLLAVPAWATIGALYLHLDDALALTFTAAALLAVARGRWVPTGVLLGLAVATKPWAIFMVPMIFGLAREVRAKTLLVSMCAALAFWLPFLIAAPATVGALGSNGELVARDSGVRLLGVHDAIAPAWTRALQLSAASVLAMIVALRGRWTLVPIVAVAVRVALDPYTFSYYDGGLVAAALVWDVTAGRRRPVATFAALVVGFLPIALRHVDVEAAGWFRVAGCALLVIAAMRSAGADRYADEPDEPAATGVQALTTSRSEMIPMTSPSSSTTR